MYSNYLILGSAWIIYCLLHSLLAAEKAKRFFKNATGKLFRYYRLAYSLFATVTLVPVLIYQYSFSSPVIIHSLLLRYFSIPVLILPGLVIMAIAIFKYFKLLSGIRSLYRPISPAELKLDGIHKLVRHPLYLGTLLSIWGFFFVFPLLNNLIAAGIITIYVLIGITFEEKKLLKEFGSKYSDYIENVPSLIPRFRKSLK